MAGHEVGDALLLTAKGLLALGRPSEVVALALSLETHDAASREVPIVLALAADHQQNADLVAAELQRADPTMVAQHCPAASVRAGLLHDDHRLVGAVLSRLGDVPSSDLPTIVGMLRSAGHISEARQAARELGGRTGPLVRDPHVRRHLAWVEQPPDALTDRALPVGTRLAAGVVAPVAPAETTALEEVPDTLTLEAFAGLALMAQADPLAADATAPGIDDASRRRATSLDLHVVPRDYSSWPRMPERLWTIVCGRSPASPFGIAPDFPFPAAVEPLFVGFSLVGAAELDAAAIDYLASKEPIGCADVPSVVMLLRAGVRAFYSGRVEATLPDTLDAASHRWAADESDEAVCLTRAVRTAAKLANGTGDVSTDKVSVFAAAQAFGRPVRLTSARPGHAELDGPVHEREGMRPAAELARHVTQAVRDVLEAAARDEPVETIRRRWAEAWAADVSAAERLWLEPVGGPAPSQQPLEAARRIRESARRYVPRAEVASNPIHVSLATDHNLLDQLPVTLEGIVGNTDRPLSITVLTRGVDVEVERLLAAAHPAVEFSFFPCDAIDHGGRLIKHITASTMDRLLLPEILPSHGRTVYVDIDALVLDDIGELYDWDLDGAPLAARTSKHSVQSIAVNLSASLPPDDARELRDTVLHQASHRARGLNAGVLVLDLDQMRRDDFCGRFVPWISRFHLNDQEVLEFYAGDRRSELPDRWNSWPYREVVDNPAVLHWVGPFKPWRQTITRGQQTWAHYARLAEERLRAARGRSADPKATG